MPISYLGANRGVGLALVTALLKKEDTIVFAGARDVDAPSLVELSERYQGKLEIVKLDSGDEGSSQAAARLVESKVGKLDVVYANAGISRFMPRAVDTPLSEFTDHINVNVLGPLVLFKAVYQLLEKSSTMGKFIVHSSMAGSITQMSSMTTAPYGLSKAGVNYLCRKLQIEHQNLIIVAICPGLVYTDMVKTFGEQLGQNFESMSSTPDDAASAVIAHVDSLTGPEKESDSFRTMMGGGRDVPY